MLILSLIALPLFAWGRGRGGGAFLEGFSRRLAHPVWWLLPAFLLFVGDALPDPTGQGIWYFLVFFVLGYLVVRDAAFIESAERFRLPALALGLALCAWWSLTQSFRDSLPDPSPQLAAIVYLGMMGSWLMMVGLLGYGRRHLDRPSPALAYLAEGSYPVYVLHQTVIVVFAFYLVGWAVWEPLQWVALLALSVLGTFALYEVVRRWSVTRFLFGMRRNEAADQARWTRPDRRASSRRRRRRQPLGALGLPDRRAPASCALLAAPARCRHDADETVRVVPKRPGMAQHRGLPETWTGRHDRVQLTHSRRARPTDACRTSITGSTPVAASNDFPASGDFRLCARALNFRIGRTADIRPTRRGGIRRHWDARDATKPGAARHVTQAYTHRDT